MHTKKVVDVVAVWGEFQGKRETTSMTPVELYVMA
jgi:hypothetical protein